MKIIYILLTIILFFSCDNIEFKSLYSANPPYIDLQLLTAGNHGGAYVGDYLLLLRSENRYNSRFGGFLIFINSSETAVSQMKSQGEASYVLGNAGGESSAVYNPSNGIDVQLAILFTIRPAPADNIILYYSTNYTLTKILPHDPALLIPGNYLMMRSYLWDSVNNAILEIGKPGNVVQIP